MAIFNVLSNGLVGDGTTNDGPALNTLIGTAAVGDTLYFPNATYLINTSAIVNKRLHLISDYATIKTTSNITMFDLSGASAQLIYVKNFIFLGDGETSGKTSQIGVRYLNGKNVVSGCVFQDIGGTAIRVQFSSAPSHGGIIEYPQIHDCLIGVECIANFAGEYVTLTGGIIGHCTTGIKLGAGNFIATGVHCDYNTTGVDMVASVNDGHGMLVGCTFNHSVTSFKSVGTELAMDIIGCRIYSGNVYVEDSKSIRFKDCGFRVSDVTIDNSSGCIEGSLIDTHGGAAFNVIWVGGSTNAFKFDNNHDIDGNTVAYMTKSSTTTLTELDNDILATGTITLTLPPAYKKFDKEFTITNIGSGIITIGATIGGVVNPTLSTQNSFMRLKSDGVDYHLIGRSSPNVTGSGNSQVTINR